MDGKDGLILWTLGGAGVLLLYAAYANKSPRAVLAATIGNPAPAAAGTAPSTGPAPAGAAPTNPGPTSTGTDASGTAYLFDADGNMAGVVPGPYQSTPQLYIPPKGAVFNA